MWESLEFHMQSDICKLFAVKIIAFAQDIFANQCTLSSTLILCRCLIVYAAMSAIIRHDKILCENLMARYA